MPTAHATTALPASIVLDTNTTLALWMFGDPTLQALRAWIETGSCILFSRADALEELRHVLAYPQFGLDEPRQAALRADYLARTTLVTRTEAAAALPTCRDPDDQKFLEIAAAAGAACLLTRDKALLRLARHRLARERFSIMTPERLSQAFAEARQPPA